jgi:hypothetical protein
MIKSFAHKQWDYINTRTGFKFECCEGTTYAGKSQAQQFKFGLAVLESKYPYHIIACISGGKAESMIQNENGFLELFPFAKYYGKGDRDIRLAHIKFAGKIIYVCGYKNKDAYELIRGMNTIGVSMVDELNLCHEDFYKELLIRSNDFMMSSTNPDDPRLPCFLDLVNHCRPYKKYAADVPKEIMADLEKSTPLDYYRYWFFSFNDNPAATPEIIEDKKRKAVPGSKTWKNLIVGLRGRATGLIFSMFKDKNVVSARDIKRMMEDGEITPLCYSCGVDTAYSSKSDDATVFTFQMITTDRKVIILDEACFNNRDLENPLAPSDVVPNLINFLKKNQAEWGYCRDVWIDSADQATSMEIEKYQRANWNCPYTFNNAAKQTKIIDRIKMMQSWIYTGHYLVCDHCKEHLHELSVYSWDEGKISTPEDRNDHTINSSQYGWLPYKWELGATKYEE